MDRSELISEIKASMGIHAEELEPETIKKVLEKMTEVIIRSLRGGEKVRIDNLCVFKPYTKKTTRSYNNLNTGKDCRYLVPAKNWVKASWSRNFLKGIQP